MFGWKKEALRYSLLFLTGYCVYLALEVTVRGYSFRLMGFTGGTAMVLIGFMIRHGLWKMQLPVQMLAGAVVITFLELISGMFALNVMGVRMWDYRGEWLSMCRNLICPRFSLYWYLLSGVAVFFTGAVDYYVLGSCPQPIYRIFRWRIHFPRVRRMYQDQAEKGKNGR